MYSALILAVMGGLVVFVNGGNELALLTVFIILASMGWGRLVTRHFKLQAYPEMQFVIGMTAVAYVLALPVYFLHISIIYPATVAIVGIFGLVLRAEPGADDKIRLEWVLTIAAISGFSIIWSLESSARYAFLAQDKLRLWVDVFIHAGTIAEFGDPKMVGRGLSALVDTAPTFYHFASYALPGLPVRILGISPLDAIPQFWYPLGIFLTVTAIFAAGRVLCGLSGGSLAVALFALVPDASAYGLGQGFLSFHWMMETSPGSLYALPASLAAVGVLIEWTRNRNRRLLVLAFCLLASVFLLRAHIFLWLSLPFAVVVIACLPPHMHRLRFRLIIGGTFAFIMMLLLIAKSEIKHLGIQTFLVRFIEALHTKMGPTNYEGVYLRLMELLGPLGALPFGLILALLGMAGIWLVTFSVGLAHAARSKKLEVIDCLPVTLLLSACIMMTMAPTPFHGDYSDFRQRAFILVYVVMIIWTAKFALQFTQKTVTPMVASTAALAALASTILWMPTAKISHVVLDRPYDNIDITPGVIAAGRWIHQEAKRGESIAVADIPTDEKLYDIPTVLMSLSGAPAYVSRAGLYLVSGPPRADTVRERLEKLRRIHEAPTPTEANQWLLQDGIGFYVTQKENPPAWDREGHTATLKTGDLLVWRVRS